MKKLFSLFLLFYCMISLPSVAMDAVACRRSLASAAQFGRSMISYVAQKSSGALAVASSKGRQGLLALGRFCQSGLYGMAKGVKMPLTFMQKHKKSIGYGLVASGLSYIAGKVYRNYANTHVKGGQDHDNTGGHAAQATDARAKSVQGQAYSDDFSEALNEWADYNRAYNEQVKQVGGLLNILMPVSIGVGAMCGGLCSRDTALEAAVIMGAQVAMDASIYFNKCPLLDFVVRFYAIFLSRHAYKLNEIKEQQAWNNVLRIIREQELEAKDLKRLIAESGLQLPDSRMVQLRTYMQTVSEQNHAKKMQDRAKEPLKWVGEIPEDISNLIDQINYPQDFGDIPFPKGVLMLGDPGVGKSFAAAYIAQETGCEFDIVNAASVFGCYVGDAEATIRAMFAKAKANVKRTHRPSIIFLDEADAILESREGAGGEVARQENGYDKVTHKILDQLFPLMDGPEADKDVIILFASNMPQEYFDKALVERTKRLTHIIHMERPDKETCFAMLKNAAQKYPQTKYLAEDAQTEMLGRLTTSAYAHRFTPDNLYGLIEKAARFAVGGARRRVRQDFESRGNVDQHMMREAMCEVQKRTQVSSDDIEHAFQDIIGRQGSNGAEGALDAPVRMVMQQLQQLPQSRQQELRGRIIDLLRGQQPPAECVHAHWD